MTKPLVFFVGFVLFANTWLFARPDMPDDPIARLILDLDSNCFETRRRAFQALLNIGKPAVGPLKKALAANPSLEVVVRIKELLRKLAVRADAGSAVDDLQVKLVADRKSVKVGEQVEFTVMLYNLSDEDRNVEIGYSHGRNDFVCGWAFRRLVAGPNSGVDEVKCSCLFGTCSTGAGPVFVTVPAEGHVDYIISALVMNDRERELSGFFFGDDTIGYYLLCARAGRGHSVRVHLESAPHQYPPELDLTQWSELTNTKARFWSGAIHSNDVPIAIKPDFPNDFLPALLSVPLNP